MLPARSGMARLALTAGVPIVPIGVWGMHRRWPVTGLRFRPPLRPVAAVVIGDPIVVAGDASDDDALRALTDETMRAIRSLLARARVLAGDPPSLVEPPGSESRGGSS